MDEEECGLIYPNSDISDLKKEVEELKARIDDLSNTIQNQQAELEILRANVTIKDPNDWR